MSPFSLAKNYMGTLFHFKTTTLHVCAAFEPLESTQPGSPVLPTE